MTAREHATKAFDVIRSRHQPGAIVPLTDYASAADYETLVPFSDDQPWIYEFRRRTNELAELLQEGGFHPIFVQIEPKEYLGWLGKTENSSGNRAAFVSWVAAGRPDNYTSISGEEEI